MSKRQEKIKNSLKILKQKDGVSARKIAEKIGLIPQTLHYHLNQSAELDKDIYDKLVNEIERYGIEVRDTTETFNPDNLIDVKISKDEIEMLSILRAAGYDSTKLKKDLKTLESFMKFVVEVEEGEKVKH